MSDLYLHKPQIKCEVYVLVPIIKLHIYNQQVYANHVYTYLYF